MRDLIQWLQRVFLQPSVSLGATEITPLKVIGLLMIFGLFLIAAHILRRLLRRFLARLRLSEDAQERLLWLTFLSIVCLGAVVGLAAIGIDLTLVSRVLTFSIPIGQTQLNLVKIFWALTVVIGASIVSKYLQLVLRQRVLPPFHLPANAQFLLLRFLHIGIIVLSILISISLTGIQLNSLLVVAGGLSIGLGFGLQNIASNIISGVILIFERPIRVGDQVTVGNTFGTVTAINMRSTVITTLRNINMIVPNSQFVFESITNWTYDNDRTVRIDIPIGVAYGSDTRRVKQALIEVANAHGQVLKAPGKRSPMVRAPLARFVGFSDSALRFELLVWIPEVREQFDITSDLHYMIDQKFRDYGITIAFPQRDVHLYMKSNLPAPLNELQGIAEREGAEEVNRVS